ncbi:hypothetical protein PR048_009454 [Dryococelus australis]|uniref:Uncharacterized protein n=1 Tax=Dryococelus australis TaxID=614101 RepID=A0ABQ9HZZ5_9NEOP|nr:hypothetical protein PR048_009454 [Dryococelus australis]
MWCTLKDMDVVREKRCGLRSCFIFKCRINTRVEKMDVNTAAVSGTISSGGEYAQLEGVF